MIFTADTAAQGGAASFFIDGYSDEVFPLFAEARSWNIEKLGAGVSKLHVDLNGNVQLAQHEARVDHDEELQRVQDRQAWLKKLRMYRTLGDITEPEIEIMMEISSTAHMRKGAKLMIEASSNTKKIIQPYLLDLAHALIVRRFEHLQTNKDNVMCAASMRWNIDTGEITLNCNKPKIVFENEETTFTES